jgi:hypothetical protein
MTGRQHRRAVYNGLLYACRGQSIEWLKRCAFGLDHCTHATKRTEHHRIMRAAVRSAIRLREAEAAAVAA